VTARHRLRPGIGDPEVEDGPREDGRALAARIAAATPGQRRRVIDEVSPPDPDDGDAQAERMTLSKDWNAR
jgi:hypothetical protein